MISKSITNASLVITAFVVAVVGTAPSAQAVTFTECDIQDLSAQNVGAPQLMRLIIDGDATLAGTALTSSTDLLNALTTMGATGGMNEIAKINILKNKKGLDGIVTNSFLAAAQHSLDNNTAWTRPVSSITIGKIEAYYYDAGTGQGCLRVLMETTSWHTDVSHAARTIAYRWTIHGKFSVAERVLPEDDGSYNSMDVFNTGSETVAISESAAQDSAGDPFMFKLYAKGGDTTTAHYITAIKVEKRTPSGIFVPAPSLQTVTDESCIDMLFKEDPPQTLSPDAAPHFYCLGRCENPPIINTP